MKRITISLLTTLLVLLMGISVVFADEVDVCIVLTNTEDAALMATFDKNAASRIKGTDGLVSYTTEGENIVVSFDRQAYFSLDLDDRKEYMAAMLKSIASSKMSTRAKNKAYNFIAEQDSKITSVLGYLKTDTQADIMKAGYILRPFSNVISVVLGVITIVSFIATSLSIGLDVFYISIPGWQSIVDSFSAGRIKEKGTPYLVSHEAYSAYIDSVKSSEYKSVIGEYMRRRVPQVIILSVCLLYLLSGYLYDVIIFIVQAFQNAVR